jgi:hypothetical protein
MIKAAFLQLDYWNHYYASSPYKYFFTNGGYHGTKALINLYCIKDGEDIKKALAFHDYDFLILDQGLATHEFIVDVKKPKMFLALDIHAWDQKAWDSFNGAVKATDYTLTQYPFATFPDYVPFHPWKTPCEREKFIFFPHHVADSMINRDTSAGYLTRDKFLLSGSRGRPTYDYRADVEDMINRREEDRVFEILSNTAKIEHENYLLYLRKFRGAITCNSKFAYTVSKYTEIPSQATILIAPPIPEEEADIMGFEHMENVCWVKDPKNVIQICEMLCEQKSNEASLMIAHAGRDLIDRCHTTHARYRFLELLMAEHVREGRVNFDRGVKLLKESYRK